MSEPETTPTASPAPTRPRNHVGRLVTAFAAIAAGAFMWSCASAHRGPDSQETVVLGQSRWDAEGPVALRIHVRERGAGDPIPDAEVSVRLQTSEGVKLPIADLSTDSQGTVAESLALPPLTSGPQTLHIDVESRHGRDLIAREIEVAPAGRLLLASDKPLYQPGQTIHLRALLAHEQSGKPLADKSVMFEIEDGRGNKVFKQVGRTSRFGIVSADFELANEVNLGSYRIRATGPQAEVERSVEVKRYTLPKFKVGVTLEENVVRPGEIIRGRVNADYLFGKPVAGADIKITLLSGGSDGDSAAAITGDTDAQGEYRFSISAPEEPGPFTLLAEVRDAGGHLQRRTTTMRVSDGSLTVVAIPECGVLIPNVENLIHVMTSFPDGRPAVCRVETGNSKAITDERGLAVLRVTPDSRGGIPAIVARDADGRQVSTEIRADANQVPRPLLARPDQAVYAPGDTARIDVFAGADADAGPVFVDVIKNGRTTLTRSFEMKGRTGRFELAIPGRLTGLLNLHVYQLDSRGMPRGVLRRVFVRPDTGLKIAAKLRKQTHAPAEIATLNVEVTDAAGRPAPSALGVSVVDEAVFALAGGGSDFAPQLLNEQLNGLTTTAPIAQFATPSRLLAADPPDQPLATAYLASLPERAAGMDALQALLDTGYIHPQTLERIERMRGTPDFDYFRDHPDYAEIVRLIEGSDGDMNLRANTGPQKEFAAEKRREEFERKAEAVFASLLALAVLGAPMFLSLFSCFHGAPIDDRSDPKTSVARRSYMQHHVLCALAFFPVCFYPVALIGGASTVWAPDNPAAFLIASECIFVLLSALLLFLANNKPRTPEIAAPLRVLNQTLALFIWQFTVARIGFVVLATRDWRYWGDLGGLSLLWFLVSLALMAWALSVSNRETTRHCKPLGVELPTGLNRAVEWLVVVAIMAILAGMLLPALAKAKARAHRISLMSSLKEVAMGQRIAEHDGIELSSAESADRPRVRRRFPETLYWRPEVITDDQGRATLEIPLADSITTWRASLEAVDMAGSLGAEQLPIPVFQEFFIDLDPPLELTLGDEIDMPAICHNHLDTPQTVALELAPGPWFETLPAPPPDARHMPDSARLRTVSLQPGEVRAVSFRIRALECGVHPLLVTAKGHTAADAIERTIRVKPTGQKIEQIENTVLRQRLHSTFRLDPHALPKSESLVLKFYPSRFSEVMEGLDGMLRAPYGCFEQTSSTTYPNVLTLDYLTRVKRLTPEVEKRARGFIDAGYQRLLTFEVPGGGFEWFGSPPANVCLTAYGVLEFTDMARVHQVDPRVIDHAIDWLARHQNSDGSWTSGRALHSWSPNRSLTTAYVAWALAESGRHPACLPRALDWIRNHPESLNTTYTRALAANAFLARDPHAAFGKKLVGELLRAATREPGGGIWWNSDGASMTCSRGRDLRVETSALSALALMKAGGSSLTVKESLAWISEQKRPRGDWGSPQATILAMRALLQGTDAHLGQDFSSVIEVRLNDRLVETLQINKGNSDVMRLVSLSLGTLNQFRSLAFHFATVAFIATIAALPHHLLEFAIPNFSREKMILLANGAYLLTLAAMMRRPGWSVFASFLFGFGIAHYIEYLDYLELYAIQAGLLFLLIHSLCWKTRDRDGWPVRTAAAVALIAHSFIWGNIVNFRVTDIHVGFTIMLAGLLLIGTWFIIGRLRGEWGPKLIPWTGALMIASVPANYAVDFLKDAPKGHLTILASFLLFAIGVAYALNRHRWMGEEKGIPETGVTV